MVEYFLSYVNGLLDSVVHLKNVLTKIHSTRLLIPVKFRFNLNLVDNELKMHKKAFF